MDVSGRDYTSRHENQDYCFCSPHCKSEFDRSPERYASASGPNPQGMGPQGQRGGSAHPIGRNPVAGTEEPGGEAGLGGAGSSPHGLGPLDQRQGEGFRVQPGMGDRRGGMIADLPGPQSNQESGVKKNKTARASRKGGEQKKYGT